MALSRRTWTVVSFACKPYGSAATHKTCLTCILHADPRERLSRVPEAPTNNLSLPVRGLRSLFFCKSFIRLIDSQRYIRFTFCRHSVKSLVIDFFLYLTIQS